MVDGNDEVCLSPQELRVISVLTGEFMSFEVIAKAVGVSLKQEDEKPLIHRQQVQELHRVLKSLINMKKVVCGVMFQAKNIVGVDYDLYGYKLLPRGTQ